MCRGDGHSSSLWLRRMNVESGLLQHVSIVIEHDYALYSPPVMEMKTLSKQYCVYHECRQPKLSNPKTPSLCSIFLALCTCSCMTLNLQPSPCSFQPATSFCSPTTT